MVTSLKRSRAYSAIFHASNLQQASANPHLCQRLPDPTGKSRTVSCGVIAPFSWVLVHKVLLCPPRVYFPVLCKFWQLCGGVNGDLLQEELCHTHSQSPCSCSRPLPTHTSTGDTQTQFIYVRILKHGFCRFYFFAGYVANTRVHRFRYSV